jgi:methylmalonyl-CoA mutase N-terminal domain/subunit
VVDVVDPLGGSYYIENLTNRLEEAAFEYIDRIDQMGGAVAAIEDGFQMREIGDAAYRHRQEVESGDRVIVGVNRYATEEPPVEGLMRVDEEAARQQVARLERLRRERDGGAAQAALGRLADVARSEDNTVPAILECVEAYATVGEIADVFRGVFGEQRETAGF